MGDTRQKFAASFKAKVVLELLRERETIAVICSRYGVHPTQAGQWKTEAARGLELIFAGKRETALAERDEMISELYKQIGQLTVERDWIKKKLG